MSSKPINPWWMVLGAAVAQVVGQGPIAQFTFGVFLKPITQEFGWNRGGASLALTLGLALTAVSTPVAGRLMDRYGVRPVAMIGISLFGLGLMALGLLVHSPMMFIVLYALVGVVAAGQTPLPYTQTIAMTFDRRRGLALAVAMAGVGLGTIIVPQVAQRLIDGFGWRGAYVGLGVLVLVIALPILAFLVGPAAARKVAAATGPGVGATTGEALRDRRLYILGAAIFLGAAAANGTIAHVVPLLTDHGVPARAAVGAMALLGLASIAGRMIAGYALDRLPGALVAGFFMLCAATGVLLLAGAPTLPVASGAIVLIGLGLGAEADLVGFLVARYFGARSFGELFGYMFGTFLLASSIGPAVMGLWFDQAGSYTPCLIGFGVGLVVAAGLFQLLGRYTYVAPVDAAAH